jgi:hypothetical protein
MCLFSGLVLIFGIFTVPMVIQNLSYGGVLKYVLYSYPSHLCTECLCLSVHICQSACLFSKNTEWIMMTLGSWGLYQSYGVNLILVRISPLLPLLYMMFKSNYEFSHKRWHRYRIYNILYI